MAKKARPGPGAPPLKSGLAEMRALAHPLRLRLLELFAEAPRTTKQVADLLDEPPTRLYHHVAALERAGLLRLTETRKNRGTTEKWYETASRTMGSAETARSKGGRRNAESAARRAVAMTVLEQARQEVVTAMQRRGGERPLLARVVMVAPADRIVEIRTRLYEVLKQVKAEFERETETSVKDDDERWAMTMTFAPVSTPRR